VAISVLEDAALTAIPFSVHLGNREIAIATAFNSPMRCVRGLTAWIDFQGVAALLPSPAFAPTELNRYF
jgi:hypothetical protein